MEASPYFVRMLVSQSVRVALFCLLAVGSCEQVAQRSFVSKSPEPYNQAIRRGRRQQQAWTSTPWRIMRHLLGPAVNEESYPFQFQQVIHPDSSRTVTITQEQLPDDAVYGERTILTFVRQEGGWVVQAVRVGYKCQLGRGHQYYAGTKCD